MKTQIYSWASLVCSLNLLFMAGLVSANDTVWNRLKSNPDTSIFAKYAKDVGLMDALNTVQLIIPWTVFAPDNSAFSKLPQEIANKLESDEKFKRHIITSHLVLGASTSVEGIGSGKQLTTASGVELDLIQKDNLYIKDAVITKKDLIATNGIIHLVECVMYVQPSLADNRLTPDQKANYDQTACCLADSIDDQHHMSIIDTKKN